MKKSSLRSALENMPLPLFIVVICITTWILVRYWHRRELCEKAGGVYVGDHCLLNVKELP